MYNQVLFNFTRSIFNSSGKPHIFNDPEAGLLVDALDDDLFSVEQLVAHNGRIQGNVQDLFTDLQFGRAHSNGFAHHFFPVIEHIELGHFSFELIGAQQFIYYFAHGRCFAGAFVLIPVVHAISGSKSNK